MKLMEAVKCRDALRVYGETSLGEEEEDVYLLQILLKLWGAL